MLDLLDKAEIYFEAIAPYAALQETAHDNAQINNNTVAILVG